MNTIRSISTFRDATRSRQTGAAMLEVVVAATLLLVVMSFVASMVFRIDLVWKDTGYHRAAMNELSNQLEHLTLLSPSERSTAMDALEPSAIVSRVLPEPELSGDLFEDEWGQRIVLRLRWKRSGVGKSVELVAWALQQEAKP